jgi:hypothetical protein
MPRPYQEQGTCGGETLCSCWVVYQQQDTLKRPRGSASNQHERAMFTQPQLRRRTCSRETVVSLLIVNSFSRRSDWAGVCDPFGAAHRPQWADPAIRGALLDDTKTSRVTRSSQSPSKNAVSRRGSR